MNRKKALELEKELKGKDFNGYSVIEYINNGKSAAVFKAEKDGTLFALKIFDNDLVESTGHEIQDKRIAQELSLKDHKVPHLIKIIDGGSFNYNNEQLHYMVMEYLTGQNLKEYIQNNNYSEETIKSILSSLYETCEELIKQHEIVHRDIKPENIMISESGVITLMDLGVLKFIGTPSFSDGDEKAFVGTLRYAPPEFITRKEVDDINGWKAINLYQIGGVLHDLITKKELFHNKTPYTNLVRAILEDMPDFTSNEYSTQLIQLTRNLFIKSPETRLKITIPLVESYIKESSENTPVESILQKHKEISVANELKIIQIEDLQRTDKEKRELRSKNLSELASVFTNIISDLKENDKIIGSFQIGAYFRYTSDHYNHLNTSSAVINVPFKISKDLKMGFPQNFYFSFGIRVDESKLASISCVAFYPGQGMYFAENMDSFETMVWQALNPNIQINALYRMGGNQNYNKNFKSFEIFNGIYSNDVSFKEIIKEQILKILFKAKEIGQNDVDAELKEQSNYYVAEKIQIPQKTLKLPMFFN